MGWWRQWVAYNLYNQWLQTYQMGQSIWHLLTFSPGQRCIMIDDCTRGATTAEKLRGTKVWVPTPGRLRPAPGQRPGWGGCGRGSPSRCGGPGVLPRKIFENSNAKSCILVASALISVLPRTCISEQTTSMSRAKPVPKFQLFSHGCAPGC